jgi:hypothetical protein
MNVAMTADDATLTLQSERPEGILSFLASRSKSSARTLSPDISEVFNGCASQVRGILCTIVETRTQADYRREFERSFSKYVGLTLAMSHFASAVIPRESIERLSRESICELEADFRDKGIDAFGEDVRNQALFTVWTLRKVNDLVDQIIAAKLDDSKKKADGVSCGRFNFHLFRAQFGLDCLNLAIETNKAIYPEVIDELTDGLKSMINAYAHAREGLELRLPTVEPTLSIPLMDDEDRALLETSMRSANDLAVEL